MTAQVSAGDPQARTEAELARLIRDPISFCEVILGDDLWDIQKRILTEIAKPFAKVAVRACHASSKTFTAGDVVVWFMVRYHDAIVPTTAPTWNQVKNLLWKEIGRAKKQADKQIKGLPDVLTSDWIFARDERYATGLSTTDSDRFQGFHSAHVLLVFDEATGVRQDIWTAAEGISAGGDVRWLALGNPTLSRGPFFDAFAKDRSGWVVISISAFDTPNLQRDPAAGEGSGTLTIEDLLRMEATDPGALYHNVRPYMITRAWVIAMFHKWGPVSPLYISRVLGRFPGKGEDNLIGLDDIEYARQVQPRPGVHCLGVDVARYGSNYTGFAEIYGNKLVRLWRVQGRSTTDTARVVRDMWQKDPSMVIVVDDSGVGGAVTDRLREDDIPVVAYNAGNSPIYSDDALNRGAESYWSLAEAFKSGDICIAVGDDESVDEETFDVLCEQLVGVEYGFTAKGKIQIYKTSKKDNLDSPDLGDAVNMAWEAHRVEVTNPALTSVMIEPRAEEGFSSKDRPGQFWGAGGRTNGGTITQWAAEQRGGGGSGSGGGRGSSDRSQAGAVDAEFRFIDSEKSVTMICPQCGDLGSLTELGRQGDTRHFNMACAACGHTQVIHSKVKR